MLFSSAAQSDSATFVPTDEGESEVREIDSSPTSKRFKWPLKKMAKQLPYLLKVLVMAILTVWSFDLVASKTTTTSQSTAYRDAKVAQDADRRATEIKREQILADWGAKFNQQQGYGNNYNNYNTYNVNYSGYGNSASTNQYQGQNQYRSNKHRSNKYQSNQYQSNQYQTNQYQRQ